MVTVEIPIHKKNPIQLQSFATLPLIERVVQTDIGSLGNENDLKSAAEIVASGGVVAAQMWGVYGVWVDGANQDAINNVHLHIKQTPRGKDRTMTIMMDTNRLSGIIDRSEIHPDIRNLFGEDGDDLSTIRNKVGAICHLRLPIRTNSIIEDNIPRGIIKQDDDGRFFIQNLDPHGHPLMEKFIEELHKKGIRYPAVTSLNRSGVMPEITDFEMAERFVKEVGLPLLMSDPLYNQPKVRGSFTIIDVARLEAVREGSVPVALMEIILGLAQLPEECKIKTSSMKQPKFTQADLSFLIGKNDESSDIRDEILNFLQGKTNEAEHWVTESRENGS